MNDNPDNNLSHALAQILFTAAAQFAVLPGASQLRYAAALYMEAAVHAVNAGLSRTEFIESAERIWDKAAAGVSLPVESRN